jgi:hypothetical protein
MHREKKNYGNRHTMGIGQFNDRLIYFWQIIDKVFEPKRTLHHATLIL